MVKNDTTPCRLKIDQRDTMRQKFSKCEVKAAQYGNFTILLQLKFYVKSNFRKIRISKKCNFDSFKDFKH